MKRGRIIHQFYETFLSLKGAPDALAAGLALGIFVGVTPTIPFHTAIILLLALPLRLNITAAYLGSWIISNPVTIPILYASQYELGRVLLGMQHPPIVFAGCSLEEIVIMGGKILFPLQIGGILMAPFIAVPAYFVSYHLIRVLRARERL